MLRLSEALLRDDVARLQHLLATYRPSPSDLTALGRTLFWLQDPTAATYLRQAVTEYTPDPENPNMLLRTGHLWRLAGEYAQAQTFWQQAYATLHDALHQSRPEAELFDHLHWLSMACFLTGRDVEAESTAHLAATAAQRTQHVTQYALYHEPPLLHELIALLARARRTRTPAHAATALEQLITAIKRYHASIGETRLIETSRCPLWDWYDLALTLLHDLDPAQGTGYTPVPVPGVPLPSFALDTKLHERALHYLHAYQVTQVAWVYYVLDWSPENGNVAFVQLTLADGRMIAPETLTDYELLDALWTCFEIIAEEGLMGGQYHLDVAQRRIRRIASVLNERGWEGAWEPETLDELIVTPLPEQQQEVIELHPDRLVIHFVYDH
jgi:tetratricopeptide (TPR) repeat protein